MDPAFRDAHLLMNGVRQPQNCCQLYCTYCNLLSWNRFCFSWRERERERGMYGFGESSRSFTPTLLHYRNKNRTHVKMSIEEWLHERSVKSSLALPISLERAPQIVYGPHDTQKSVSDTLHGVPVCAPHLRSKPFSQLHWINHECRQVYRYSWERAFEGFSKIAGRGAPQRSCTRHFISGYVFHRNSRHGLSISCLKSQHCSKHSL